MRENEGGQGMKNGGREIKFRVWKGSYYKEPMFTLEDIACNIDDIGDNIGNRQELVWEQFTGLHDKNGREIYEGDILEFVDRKELFIVKWSEHSCGFFIYHVTPGLMNYPMLDPMTAYTVIGNIHANPELLEPNS